MATQLADRGPHPDLWCAKFGPPHFLEVALGTSLYGDIFCHENNQLLEYTYDQGTQAPLIEIK